MKFLDLSSLTQIGQKKNKEEIRYNCPFCKERKGTPDTKGHLYVNLKEGLFHCFRCDASPKTVGYFLKSYTLVPDPSSRKSSKQPLLVDQDKIPKKPRWYSSLRESKPGFFPDYRNYALSRGIIDSDIDKYEIGFTTDLESPFFGRLVFCHFDESSGVLDFIQGRWILEDIPNDCKYLSSKVPEGEKPLFKSFMGKVKCGIIVEGVFDMIQASRFIPAAALLGHNITEKQRKQIAESFSEKIILALDSDALEGIIPCMRMFIEGIEVQPIFLPRKDMGEMEQTEVKKLLEKFT